MTPTQVDNLYGLEEGYCLEACKLGWIDAIENPKGVWNVSPDSAKSFYGIRDIEDWNANS